MLGKLARFAFRRGLAAAAPRRWILSALAMTGLRLVGRLIARREGPLHRFELTPGALFQVETTKPLTRRQRRRARRRASASVEAGAAG